MSGYGLLMVPDRAVDFPEDVVKEFNYCDHCKVGFLGGGFRAMCKACEDKDPRGKQIARAKGGA